MLPGQLKTLATVARIGPVAILAILVLIGFGRLARHPDQLIVDGERPSLDHARPPGARSVGNDLTRLFLPRFLQVSESVRRLGRVPGWDPSGFGGRPLVGNPQAGLWYPPVWLAWLSGAPSVLGWLTVAHLVWGGLGAYALGRAVGLGRWSAALAGGAFELSPYLMAQTLEGHLPHVWSACWGPWAFLAALALRRGERVGGLMLPVVLAMAYLTGHPQEAYYLSLALGAWASWEIVRAGWAGGGRAAIRRVAVVVVLGLLTIGLLAVEWLPAAEAGAWGLRPVEMSSRRASRYSVGPLNLLQLGHPLALGGASDYFGDVNWWESVLCFGSVALVLAVVGIRASRRREVVLGWAVLAGLSIAFATGRRLGLFSILYRVVPGMDRFRVPARALFLAALGMAMLAGLGAEAIARRRVSSARVARRAAWIAGTLGLALAAFAWVASRRGIGDLSPSVLHEAEVARWLRAASNLAAEPVVWAALGLPAIAFAWLARRPSDRRAVAAVLGALALAELALHAITILRIAPADRFLPPETLAAEVVRVRPDGPFRVRGRDAYLDDLRARGLGLEKTNLDDAFQIQHAADLYETLYPIFDPPRMAELFDPQAAWFLARTRQAVLDRMNVALLITDRPEPHAPWPVAARGSGFLIYRNPTVLPRAYVVPRAFAWPDEPSAVGLLGFVPPREAVVMPVDPLGTAEPRQPFTTAEYDSPEPDRVEVRVTTRAPGLLVVADTWMPGWSATLDGRPVPLLRGNRAQRVVALDRPGRHHVVMRYEPPGLASGVAISGASLAAWLAGVVAFGRKRRFTTETRRSTEVAQREWGSEPSARSRTGRDTPGARRRGAGSVGTS